VVVLNNSGTIKSNLSGQGVDFDGLTGATVTINNNTGGLIQGADQDGVPPRQWRDRQQQRNHPGDHRHGLWQL
jgi:hypothetical protein